MVNIWFVACSQSVLICYSHFIEWNNPSQIIVRKVCPIDFVLCTFIILSSTQNTYETSGYNCGHTAGFADWKEGGIAKVVQNWPAALIENALLMQHM